MVVIGGFLTIGGRSTREGEYGACGWTVEPHRLDTCVAEIGHPEGQGKKRISIVCGENKP